MFVAKHFTVTVICFISLSGFQCHVSNEQFKFIVSFFPSCALVSGNSYENNSVKTQLTLFFDFNVIHFCCCCHTSNYRFVVFTNNFNAFEKCTGDFLEQIAETFHNAKAEKIVFILNLEIRNRNESPLCLGRLTFEISLLN